MYSALENIGSLKQYTVGRIMGSHSFTVCVNLRNKFHKLLLRSGLIFSAQDLIYSTMPNVSSQLKSRRCLGRGTYQSMWRAYVAGLGDVVSGCARDQLAVVTQGVWSSNGHSHFCAISLIITIMQKKRKYELKKKTWKQGPKCEHNHKIWTEWVCLNNVWWMSAAFKKT